MKILLIGEYSRFHNSLKEGLVALGHQVTLVGDGDAFKQYPVDIDISPRWFTGKGLLHKVRMFVHKVFSIDLLHIETGRQFKKHASNFIGYDVVQFINSWSIRTTVSQEKYWIDYLSKHNKKLFLSACGTDVIFVESLFNDKLPYNLLTPYFEKRLEEKHYPAIFRYKTEKHKSLYKYLVSKVTAIIPTDMDYFLAYHTNGKPEKYSKATTLVPTPINLEKLTFKPLSVTGKIIIFHGINRKSYFKKGNDVFEKAIEIILEKYPEKVEVITVTSLPYDEYITSYNSAHIILDQVYSHDQGYNALEAMAKGKVVCTGAGEHFKRFYNLDKTVAIDATPNPKEIVTKLEHLILNPDNIVEIGKNARDFVEAHHSHITIAKQYVDIWKQ